MTQPDLIAVARGDRPADLLIRGGRVVNLFSGEIEEVDIAVAGNKIAGLGRDYHASEVIDARGAFVVPGLIDAHVHIESSLCTPAQFTAAILPRGVTCAVIDPHEIANVAGLTGIRFMAENSRQLPLTTLVMASSCVPASTMETNGATLTADDLAALLREGIVYGLAEVMNYPAVIEAERAVLAKIAAFRGHPIDGHAPLVRGRALNAYIAAGISTEHECISVAEAAEKLARGLYILIREATNAQNLQALLPLITPHNSRRICFCTDDRIPQDLLDQGSIDYMVRAAIAYGIDPIEALRMATLNSAECYGLRDRGAIAPGRAADLVIVDDLQDFHARQVIAGGRLVAEDGQLLPSVELPPLTANPVGSSVNVAWNNVNFAIKARSQQIRVIGALENQLITEARILDATIIDGEAVADPDRDLLKMAVIERHHARGSFGLGFIQGIGLQQGAMAGSVAHDHHNLVVIGADDLSMMTAAHAVEEMGGGLVVALGDQIMAKLPLPIAGLMGDQPIHTIAAAYAALRAAAKAQGSPLNDPFMAMSFMALEVIPELKLTDKGLVDVNQFALVDLFV
ncbi:MAG: adenine deaminase [Caldilineaceae bacterium]|nr:adenine deaminase [Caldilineaceae bacterium]